MSNLAVARVPGAAIRSFERQAETPEQLAGRLQHLISILPSGVVILDASGVVADCNQIAVELLGEPLRRLRWRDVIQRAFAPRADDGHEVSLVDGRRVRIETRALDPEPGQLILLTDLTETRQLQEQLGHHRRLQVLGKMMASLAHQLKTPLATATLYAGHLSDPELPVNRREPFAHKIQQCLHSLTQQIDDMLRFARSGDTLVRPVQLDQLLQAFRERNDWQRIELRQQDPDGAEQAWLLANQESLLGLLENLMNNSLQAGASQLSLSSYWLTPDWLRLQIEDNGPGMSQQVLNRALEPFFTTRSTGTGLGLAVVAAVAASHQARLTLRSEPGQGLCVWLDFPVSNQGGSDVELNC